MLIGEMLHFTPLGLDTGLLRDHWRIRLKAIFTLEWRIALYVRERKCLSPPPLFKDGFSNLIWMASLTPLLNQH